MLECCKNCGHNSHLEICDEITHKKKCPCKKYILERFNNFNEVFQEYEKLLFQYEKIVKKRPDTPKESVKYIRHILCINSKTRILKKWIDENEN